MVVLAGALCAGGVWAVGFTFALAGLKVTLFPEYLPAAGEAFLLFGGGAVVVGLAAGVTVGLVRGGSERGVTALILGSVGILTGVIGGGLSTPAMVAFDPWLHPILSSALAWALAGFFAGLIGCSWSRWVKPPPPNEGEEPEVNESAPRRVEWLLRQREPRRLRDWPLFRVLPVLIVSALLLVGAAALAPSDAALAAAGAVGLAAALVLHAQEYRIRHLEARLRDLERRLRDTREDGA